jgi:signal transduction histidine kinase
MNAGQAILTRLHHGSRRRTPEAGAALFQDLRIRLTLWYCGVLSVALVLFGVALYLGTQYFLLSPIEHQVAQNAQMHAHLWLSDHLDDACPLSQHPEQFGPSTPGFQMPEMLACFDQHGVLLPGEHTIGLPPAFLSNLAPVQAALQTGQPATDTVDGGEHVGPIYRYALAVPNADGSGYSGVVLIGESIGAQESALSALLALLLVLGGMALLGASVGGLFLANRALAPARLAWSNQQRFIADASHELRTPLTLLRADAEVLLRSRERLPSEDAALLEDIVTEANHMGHLASNLLALARLDAGAVHREHEVVSLGALARRTVRRVAALAEQRGVTVQLEEVSNDVYVIGDSVLLEQAALALLDNAIKYNRSGGQVNMRVEKRNGAALLEINDTGIGIPAEHLPHLGERFYRVDKARSRRAGGTGLGLSIARGIAATHGGELRMTSVPEKGTTVTFMLPLANLTARDAGRSLQR